MVRLICYNIEYCQGIKGRWYEYLNIIREFFFPPKKLDQKIISALKKLNPDILGLVEVDTGSIRTNHKDEVVFFSKGLKMKNFDEAIKYTNKGTSKFMMKFFPIMRKQAIALLTKYKITDVKHHVLHRGFKRILIEATVHTPKKVTILLAHLALGKKARKKQITEIIDIVNSIKNPVILMGDFNTFKGEEEIEELLKKTHLKYKAKIGKKTFQYTQPSYKPKRLLDYVLTSPQIKVKQYEALKFSFSDHLPLFVEFEVE